MSAPTVYRSVRIRFAPEEAARAGSEEIASPGQP